MPESRKQRRVFVVHDEFVVASSLAAMLQHQGFDARSFTDPLKAVSAAASEAPALLISKFAMPLCSQGANWRVKCGNTAQIARCSFSRRKG